MVTLALRSTFRSKTRCRRHLVESAVALRHPENLTPCRLCTAPPLSLFAGGAPIPEANCHGTKHEAEVSPRKYHAYPTGFKPQAPRGGVAKGNKRSAIAEPHSYPSDTCGEIYRHTYDYQDARPYQAHSRYDASTYMYGGSTTERTDRKEGGSGIYVVPID